MSEVVTGEAVVIEVPCARFPSRMLALGIDLLIQLVLLVVILIGVGVAATTGGGLDGASAAAIGLAGAVLVIVGYPTIFETLSRGKSLGKLALGLRVVSDDGGPERFRQALARALMAAVEIWILLGFPALIASLLSAKGKRLGDLWAGTFVIQERLPARQGLAAPLAAAPPALVGWASTLELSGLTDATAETARQYLSRFYELTPAARTEFGQRIAAAVAAQVSPMPPPGTGAADYLAAVLAERRGREHARMMGPGWQPPGAASGPAAGSPGPRPGRAPEAAAVRPAHAEAAQPAARQEPGPDDAADAPVPEGPAQRSRPAAVRPGGFRPPE